MHDEAAVADDDPWARGSPGPSRERIAANIERIVAREREQRGEKVIDAPVTTRHDPSIIRERDDFEQRVIDILRVSNIRLRKSDIADKLGIPLPPQSDLAATLAKLVDEGAVDKTGVTSATTYWIADDGSEDYEPVDAEVGAEEPEPAPEPEPDAASSTESPSESFDERVETIAWSVYRSILDGAEQRSLRSYLAYSERYLETLLDQLERPDQRYSDWAHLNDRIERTLAHLRSLAEEGP